MLKLSANPKEGVRIIIPESWHDKIVNLGKIANCPYEFSVLKSHKDSSKQKFFICEGERKEKGKKLKIVLEEYAIKYLLADEVPDANIGFSFKEFLPLENSSILLSNTQNPNEIVPATLNLNVGEIEIDGESFILLSFMLNYMNGIGFANVKYYAEGCKKSSWKFLFNNDESYMSDFEKTFKDTLVHKSYVEKSAAKLIRYLEKEQAFEHAKELKERAKNHDNSKISQADELYALSRIINDKSSLKNANNQLSPLKKDAIMLHYKNNPHHPEHFKSVLDMSKLDIMEMCCDWHARSTQYKTDFLEFVKTQQEKRFHFPDWMFAEIWHYCTILASDI